MVPQQLRAPGEPEARLDSRRVWLKAFDGEHCPLPNPSPFIRVELVQARPARGRSCASLETGAVATTGRLSIVQHAARILASAPHP